MTRFAFGGEVRQAGQAAVGRSRSRAVAGRQRLVQQRRQRRGADAGGRSAEEVRGESCRSAYLAGAGPCAHSLVIVSSRFRIMLGDGRVGGEFARDRAPRRRGDSPTCEQLLRPPRVARGSRPGARRSPPRRTAQLVRRRAAGRWPAGRPSVEPVLGRRRRPRVSIRCGQDAGRLDVGHVVQQRQRLQRRVASASRGRCRSRGRRRRTSVMRRRRRRSASRTCTGCGGTGPRPWSGS